MATLTEFQSWLKSSPLTQREKIAAIREQWLEHLRAVPDHEVAQVLLLVKKAINSKKLRAERDALVAQLWRDVPLAADPEPAPATETPPPAPTPPQDDPTRNAELEALIAADPEAREPYLVYADWLSARGDPRGELITIQHELSKSPGSGGAGGRSKKMTRAQDELLAARGAELLGLLADCDDMLQGVDWHLGFIRSCRLCLSLERFNGERDSSVTVEDALACLLDGPGRFIQHLTVGVVRHDDNTYGRVCEVIGARPRPTLRSLFLGDFTREESELNWSKIGDASVLYAAVPNLHRLTLRSGSMKLGRIELPELRELTTITGGLNRAAADSIASASWPRLELLSLQFGRASQGATADPTVVQPILDGQGLPALRHLGLTNCEFTDEICRALPRCAILPQLHVLDLCMGTMSDEGAEALASHRDALAHLKLLIVDDNYLTDAGLALLQGLCQEVALGDQRDDEADPDNRYASAFE